MNAYDLAASLEKDDTTSREMVDCADMLRQQADKLKKYELRNQEQIKRISELEKQVDELWDYKISYKNLDGGKN